MVWSPVPHSAPDGIGLRFGYQIAFLIVFHVRMKTAADLEKCIDDFKSDINENLDLVSAYAIFYFNHS